MVDDNFDWANEIVDAESLTCNTENPESCEECGS